MEFDISEEAERKKRLVLEDDLRFPNGSTTPLLIAGLDVSFVPGSNDAVGCLVVLSFPDLASLYKDCQKVCITEPYVPGYLAYRELPIMKSLIEKLKLMRPDLLPHLLFVDGNGTLHPRHFGSACHVGILTDIPTIGIGKNMLELPHESIHVSDVKARAAADLKAPGDWFAINGESGTTYGAALRSSAASKNPIFVSQGHRISLPTAIDFTLRTSRHRIPEPIRAADFESRRYIRENLSMRQHEQPQF